MSDQEISSSSVAVNDRYEESRDISLLAKDQYMREVRWTERVSHEREMQLLQRVRSARLESVQSVPNQWVLSLGKHARDELVAQYQPMILHLALKCHRFIFAKSFEVLDLVQEGNVAFLEALEKDDLSLDVGAFPTFAYIYIDRAMMAALRDRSSLVPLTHRVQSDIKALRGAKRYLADCGIDAPSVPEIAQEMGVSVERVYDLQMFQRRSVPESLHAIVAQQEMGEDRYDFVDVFFQEGQQATLSSSLLDAVHMACERLTPACREVVRLCYGLDGESEQTLDDIASLKGVTRRAVNDAENRARVHLRKMLAPHVDSENASSSVSLLTREYYTAREVALLFGVSYTTVERWARCGHLPILCSEAHRNKWLFPKSEIDELLSAEEYYTVKEVASLLGLSTKTVLSRVHSGCLPVVQKEGRQNKWLFPKSEIEALLFGEEAAS